MLLFYKPIRGSSGAMHSCMFLSMVDTLLGRFAYFIFHLSARPFLGSVGKVDPPTVCFLPRQAWSASAHVFLFYKVYLSTFYICLYWLLSHVRSRQSLEGSALFFRVLIFFDVSNIFGGGFRNVQQILPISPARAGLSVPYDLFGDICSCC